jgi:hypothetical protein
MKSSNSQRAPRPSRAPSASVHHLSPCHAAAGRSLRHADRSAATARLCGPTSLPCGPSGQIVTAALMATATTAAIESEGADGVPQLPARLDRPPVARQGRRRPVLDLVVDRDLDGQGDHQHGHHKRNPALLVQNPHKPEKGKHHLERQEDKAVAMSGALAAAGEPGRNGGLVGIGDALTVRDGSSDASSGVGARRCSKANRYSGSRPC